VKVGNKLFVLSLSSPFAPICLIRWKRKL